MAKVLVFHQLYTNYHSIRNIVSWAHHFDGFCVGIVHNVPGIQLYDDNKMIIYSGDK